MPPEVDRITLAGQLLRQGRAADARNQFEALTREMSARADTWSGLAMALAQLGDFPAACDAIDTALGLPNPPPGLWLLAANLNQDAGRLDIALAHARRVPREHPAYARARNQMAIVLTDLNQLNEAEAACREALAADPAMVRAMANLATIRLKQGSADDASRWAQVAISHQPDYLQGHVVMAMAAMQLGHQTVAERALDTVLADNPDHVDCLLMRATIDRQRHAIEPATVRIQRALALAPNRIDSISQLAEVLALAGDHEGARAQWTRVLEIEPNHLGAALRRAQTLPMVYANANEIDVARECYQSEMRDISANTEKFVGEATDADEAMQRVTASHFFLAYQGRNDLELQQITAAFVRSVLKRVRPAWFDARPLRPIENRRIRIGFASRFFYQSTAGHYFQSWITQLDRERFEVFIYYTQPSHDQLTAKIRDAADHFADYRPSVDAWATQIADDQIDILIYPEIGMDAICTTLAAFRLAPIQAAGWGHPVTTGQLNIDFYLTCSEMEPAGAATHYSEALVMLPGLGTCYAKPRIDEKCRQFDRRHYGLPVDETLYLVPQSLFKIHPDNDALFASVLAAHIDSRLVFFSGNSVAVRKLFESRLDAALISAGVVLSERVLFLPDVAHADYLRINQICDVMLDTLHWSGGNTSLDALSVGLPIVTLPGAYMRGRQSMAMLRRLGLSELVVSNTHEYAERAVALGKDADYRARVSQQIIANHHRLFDDTAPVTALHDFLYRVAVTPTDSSIPTGTTGSSEIAKPPLE